MIVNDHSNMPSFPCGIASHTDVLRGSSHVPVPRTSAELKDKFLSRSHVQIIREPIGAVKVKMLTSQMRRTSSVVCHM